MLVYESNKWQKLGFKKAQMDNDGIPYLTKQASDEFKSFGNLLGDIYSRLYSGDKIEKKEELEGLEVYDSAHDILTELPEWQKMIERTKNKMVYSSMATSVIGSALYEKMPKPNEGDPPLYNIPKMKRQIQKKQDVLDFVEKENGDLEIKKQLKDNLQKMNSALDEQLELSKKLASQMDKSAIRQVLRKAINKQNEEITEMNSMCSLWGDGKAPLSPDSSEFKSLVDKYKNNSNFREILKFAGIFKSMISTAKQTKSSHGCSEVTGIELGSNLNKMVDAELVKLKYNKRQFLLDYAEGRLMQTQLEGKETKGKGPIIILLDMSGSMSRNNRHLWAKGLALALMNEAKVQKREFGLILFNGDIIQAYYSVRDSNNLFINMLYKNPSGGTNFNEPMEQSATFILSEKRKNSSYKDSDIIMISDGEGRWDGKTRENFERGKKKGDFKFFFVGIGMTILPDITEIATESFSISMENSQSSEILKSIIR